MTHKKFLCPHHVYVTSFGNDNRFKKYEGFKEYTDPGRHAPHRIVDHCKACGINLEGIRIDVSRDEVNP